MSPREFLNGRVVLHPGDCMEILPTLEAESVDAVVTDPPYHLTSIVKRFGKEGSAPVKTDDPANPIKRAYANLSRGFMGKQWDGGDIAFQPELWAEILRVLKPGGHLLAFSGSRTYHRMACAIEDAGFEIRDQIMWLYSQGFPKSLDVSKAIDKTAGFARGTNPDFRNGANTNPLTKAVKFASSGFDQSERQLTDIDNGPATDAARQWQGFGTALKPSHEPLVLARKPLIGTVAENVLAHGTGGLNVDGCRIGTDGGMGNVAGQFAEKQSDAGWGTKKFIVDDTIRGRFPANVCHDGSDEVEEAFAEQSKRVGMHSAGIQCDKIPGNKGGLFNWGSGGYSRIGDNGTASRFFYTAKADATDRLSSRHPTVKPLDLIQYLVRLITPPGGTVLDLFAGTGTTGEAAFREGMRSVLIEREAEYLADIERRMDLVYANDRDRKAAADRVRNRPRIDRYPDTGSLF